MAAHHSYVLVSALVAAAIPSREHNTLATDAVATMPHPLWMVWLGSPIHGFHRSCWESCVRVHENSHVDVHLVTSDTISKWIPSLHPSFYLLDNVAKVDYLRAELLYNYGGIYLDADVTCERSLEPLWALLRGKAVGGGAPDDDMGNLNNNMLGPFLAGSEYVSRWHQRLHHRMDLYTPQLQACALRHPSSDGGIAYPTPILAGPTICGLTWGHAIDFQIPYALEAYRDGSLVRTFAPCREGDDGDCDVEHRGCANHTLAGGC